MSIPPNESASADATNTIDDTKPARRIYRTQEQWRSLVSQYENSNLSQAAFCKQHGIASSGLYKWRKHFSEQNDEPLINITEQLTAELATHDSSLAANADWQVELTFGNMILRLRTH